MIIEYQRITCMCILDGFKFFARNGAQVFSAAARGKYNPVSPRIEMLKEELKTMPDGPTVDKIKLRQDRSKISRDVTAAFEEYKSNSQK